jgi:hypothetical protein
MTGPRSAGRPWTPTEDAQLRELAVSGVKVGLIAKKLKRSPGAIYARINLVFGPRSDSPPSERLAAKSDRADGPCLRDTRITTSER